MIYGLTLKPEYKELWVNDLRSRNFKQGQNSLKKLVKFKNNRKSFELCCLGVFSERQGIPSEQMDSCYEKTVDDRLESEYEYVFPSGERCDGEPPAEWFIEFFDFEADDVHIDKFDSVEALIKFMTKMNDGHDEYKGVPQSFKKIAKWIEKNL